MTNIKFRAKKSERLKGSDCYSKCYGKDPDREILFVQPETAAMSLSPNTTRLYWRKGSFYAHVIRSSKPDRNEIKTH